MPKSASKLLSVILFVLLLASLLVSYINYQNYNIILQNLVTNANYIVTPTNKGSYQVFSRADFSIIPSATTNSANTSLNTAIALGGTIEIRAGNYTGAQLIVPGNATIVAESGVTGIKYESIANGAKIDEPAFNAAFGAYDSGSFTIATNANNTATDAKFYLAFKSDNSIYWFTTDASTVFQSVLNDSTQGDIHIKPGIYDVSKTIDFPVDDKSLIGAGKEATLLYYNAPLGVMFNITRTPGSDTAIYIENLAVRGDYGGTGILLQHAAGVHLENVIIDRFRTGVNIKGNCYVDKFISCTIGGTDTNNANNLEFDEMDGYIPSTIEIDVTDIGYNSVYGIIGTVNALWFHNSYIESTLSSAIFSTAITNSVFESSTITGSTNGNAPLVSLLNGQNNTFSNNYFYTANVAAFALGSAHNHINDNNIIIDGAHGTGVLMFTGATYNIITGNTISTPEAYFAPISQQPTNTPDYNIVKNNDFSQSGKYLMGNLNVGGHTQISGNLGFVTENTILNIANTTETTFVFNHGLADKPTSVQCSFDLAVGYTWTWSSTTNQVMVTITPNTNVTLPATYHILSAYVQFTP